MCGCVRVRGVGVDEDDALDALFVEVVYHCLSLYREGTFGKGKSKNRHWFE